MYIDASDYGVGASLYQLDEKGKEIPVQFISRKRNTTKQG